VADGSLLRSLGSACRWGAGRVELSRRTAGTAQGSVLPVLGNVYLHYGWIFGSAGRDHLRGQAPGPLCRRLLWIGFEYQDDAQRVMDALGKRLWALRTDLHPDKTRLLPSGVRRRDRRTGRSGDLDFPVHVLLGADPAREVGGCSADTQCGAETGDSVRLRLVSSPSTPAGEVQHQALTRRIQGHFNYFAVDGTSEGCCSSSSRRAVLVQVALPSSQRARLTWERFADLLREIPAPDASDHGPTGGCIHESRPRRSRDV